MDLYPGGLSDAPMRAIPITIVLSALLMAAPLPLGSAGTEQAPEITDPQNDTNPPSHAADADIVAGWYSDDGSRIVTSLKLGQLPSDQHPTLVYIMSFQHHPGCSVYYTSYGLNQSGSGPPRKEFAWGLFDNCAQNSTSYNVGRGTAGTSTDPVFEMEVPRNALPNAFKRNRLFNLTAFVFDFAYFAPCFTPVSTPACAAAAALGSQYEAADLAETDKTYAMVAGPVPPEPEVVEDMPMHNGTDGDNMTGGDDDANDSAGGNNTPGFEVVLLLAAAVALTLNSRRR